MSCERTILGWATAVTCLLACGGDVSAPSPSGSEPIVEEAPAEDRRAEEEEERRPGQSRVEAYVERARRARERAEQESVEGTMTFRMDGEARSLSHFPVPDNVLTTRTVAVKGVEADESLSVVIANFSLADASLPVDVRGNLQEAIRQGRAPRTIAVQYRRADRQLVAQGTVRIESYGDGYLSGSIDSQPMVGAGDSRGERATLSDLRFRIRVTVDELAGPLLEAISGGR